MTDKNIINAGNGDVYFQDEDKQGWTMQEAPTQPAKQWMSFSALLSVEDATALNKFFRSRNIEFKAI